MLIRKTRAGDLPACSRMASKIFKEPYPKRVLAWLTDAFKSRVDGACLVAEDNGKIAGAIFGNKILTTRPKTARISEFFVAGSCRGKGAGKALFSACISAMKKKGMKSVSLFVHGKNRRALSLYKKSGFKPFRLMLLREF